MDEELFFSSYDKSLTQREENSIQEVYKEKVIELTFMEDIKRENSKTLNFTFLSVS